MLSLGFFNLSGYGLSNIESFNSLLILMDDWIGIEWSDCYVYGQHYS